MWTLSAFADEAAEDIDGQIAATKQAGLKHIDLRNLDGFNISALPLDHAKVVKDKLDAAGIAVGMLGTPLGKIDITEDFGIDVNKLKHLGRLADIFGCRKIRVFSYFNKTDQPMAAWQAESLRRLGELKKLAGQLHLSLYHENERHIFGDVCWQVQAIAAALRDPGPPGSAGTFRMLFDFDNYNQSGEDPYGNWLKLRDITDAFHLKDSDKDCQHVPMGTGQSRAKDVLSEALARGWHGHLAMEPHLARSPAVLATGPGGKPNQKLADLSPAECFVYAADVVKKLLGEVKAPIM
jgi:sugar phosphate isomerase/epimerase